MLIGPMVPKAAIFKEPACSAEHADPLTGRCPAAVREREAEKTEKTGEEGTKKQLPQFEHSSIPATVKTLFNLTGFLTNRDAWAGAAHRKPKLDCAPNPG